MSEEAKDTVPEPAQSPYLASRYAEHLMGCAEIADAICERFGVHDDSARQACFATVVIDAKERFIFASDDEKDALAAAKADAQIKDITANPTTEQAEAVAKKTLREGVRRACELLNQAGFTPVLTREITPPQVMSTIDAYIVTELKLETRFSDLDGDDLEALIKSLSLKLDAMKSNNGHKKPTVDW